MGEQSDDRCPVSEATGTGDLPVGYEWQKDGSARRLVGPDGLVAAWVLPDVGVGGDGSLSWTLVHLKGHGPAESYEDGERCAEAALWRVDGFGVGEVRGVVLDGARLPAVCAALDAKEPHPISLPGLPGLWRLTRVSRARPVTVDARRADTRPAGDVLAGIVGPVSREATGNGSATCAVGMDGPWLWGGCRRTEWCKREAPTGAEVE